MSTYSRSGQKFIAIGAENAMHDVLSQDDSSNNDDLSESHIQRIVWMLQRPEPDTHSVSAETQI
jgi:hypothetical protein